MVGKSVATGALVSGAVLAAPAAAAGAKTSLRRLANETVNKYDNQAQTVTLTFTEIPADLTQSTNAPSGIRAAISAAFVAAGLKKEDDSGTGNLVAADFVAGTFGNADTLVTISGVHGNAVTFSYTMDLQSVPLAPASVTALDELVTHAGERHEEFQRRIAMAALTDYSAPKVHADGDTADQVSGSLQLGFQLPADLEDDHASLATVETLLIKKIRASFDHLDDMCPSTNVDDGACVTVDGANARQVVGNDVKFSFLVTPEAFATASFDLDDKYDEIKRTLGDGTTAADQDLRNAFRQEVICRLKAETLPTGVTLANAPSDTMCSEILGTTPADTTADTGDSSEESTDESSSARSVAVVSFLSTAAAAAALF